MHGTPCEEPAPLSALQHQQWHMHLQNKPYSAHQSAAPHAAWQNLRGR
jgi:hypothetical protein